MVAPFLYTQSTLCSSQLCVIECGQNIVLNRQKKRGRTMATNQLKAAYEAAEKLPLKYQDLIAEKILEEIEEAEWDEWLAQPETNANLVTIEKGLKNDIKAERIIKNIPTQKLPILF